MTISRRTMLRGLAVAPVAAALPVAAVAKPELIWTQVDLPVAPVVEKYPWKWWIGDEETMYDSFATREEALEEAQAHGFHMIAECKQGDFDLRIDYDRLADFWIDRNEERINEDGDFLKSVTKEQERDLEARLHATVLQWVKDHSVDTTAWYFAGFRNDETVEEREA